MDKSTLKLLQFVPKNHLSWFLGLLASAKFPQKWHQLVIRWFVARYGVNSEESANPPESYRTVAQFFTRQLKPGVRPIGEGIVSPIDGKLTEHGTIANGTLLQVKGKTYSVTQLLGSKTDAADFDQGYFFNFYLAPGDYHHIHSPCQGEIERAVHIPGKLWPVNVISVQEIADLFAINERVISYLRSTFGRIAVVKVGATNVGSIQLSYCDLVGNKAPEIFAKRTTASREFSPLIEIAAGEQLGSFHMGSSVILLIGGKKFKPGAACNRGVIRYGVTLGCSDE